MTLLPLDDRNVRGVKDYSYEPERVCAHPFCSKTEGLERHHLWRRSFLVGEFDWVKLPNGHQVGNVVYLCHDHHHEVTTNEARIFWSETYGDFGWWEETVETALDPQPPLSPGGEKNPARSHKHSGAEPCPRCKGTGVKPKEPERKREGERPKVNWTVRAPKDSEDGVEIIDTLLEECRKLFDREDHRGWKYFVLVEALALVVQHGALLVDDHPKPAPTKTGQVPHVDPGQTTVEEMIGGA